MKNRYSGRIVGFCVGILFASLPLAAVGVFLGYLYDLGWLQIIFRRLFLLRLQYSRKHKAAFFTPCFRLLGYVAKADGRISEAEIATVEQILSRLGIRPALRKQAKVLFNEGKQSTFHLEATLQTLVAQYRSHPVVLRMVYDLCNQVAKADGQNMAAGHRAVLSIIRRHFGIRYFDFDDLREQFRRVAGAYSSQYRQHSQGQAGAGNRASMGLTSAYKTLDLPYGADAATVKKQYRKLMSRYHPDRLIAQKKSEAEIAAATEKTQRIKAAYEAIQAARKPSHS